MNERLREILDGFDPELPLARARTVPSSWYFDPDVYAAERRAVFGDTWQLAARKDQLVDAGAFVTTEIAGEPVLVVRDHDATLRAFYNVCRHRAARVVDAPCGKLAQLRCRYHGWTYDLAGALRGAPEFKGVESFTRADNGLMPLAVDTWGPLVFVHGGPRPGSLAAHLGPLPDRQAELGIDALHFVERREYDLACNWKVYVDNFLDGGYHVNTIHPGLAGVLDYAHYTTETFVHGSLQSSPLKAPDPDRHDTSAGAVRVGDRANYYWFFPNFMVNLYPGMMDTNLVLPLGTDRCRVVIDFYYADPAATLTAESIAVGHQIQLEDVGICEDVQRGLGSRSYSTGRFSVRRDVGGYHFHRLLAAALRGGLQARP